MPAKQDEISALLTSVNNTLDPLSFANALVDDTVASKFKIFIGTTSVLPPDVPDDLWCKNEPISLMTNMDNIEQSIESLEVEAGDVGSRAKGVPL